MLITKEQQEAWVEAYVKEKHTQDECIGFIDGINKTLDVVKNNIVLPDVSAFTEWLKDNHSIEIHDMILQDYIKYGG